MHFISIVQIGRQYLAHRAANHGLQVAKQPGEDDRFRRSSRGIISLA
jgi:hypothetical protein